MRTLMLTGLILLILLKCAQSDFSTAYPFLNGSKFGINYHYGTLFK